MRIAFAPGRLAVASALFLIYGAGVAPGLAPRQSGSEHACRADYSIHVRLDEADKLLAGEELIQWHNESRNDVSDLWFHLYWNAFANNQTTHIQESGGELRGIEIKDGWGWQQVTSIRVSGRELVKEIQYQQPDDGRAQDRSVFSVKLPEIARPGEVVAVHVSWRAKIPRVRRRTGYKDDFLFIAQWFPKLGVYENDNGWNCHQFHASTEFFSDYGVYDVTLDLPAAYEEHIGASGVQAEPALVKDGRVIAHYIAPSEKDQGQPDSTGKLPLVHDFAWTADPDYVKREFTFHYDEWAAEYEDEVARVGLALGRGREELRLRDVRVTVLLQPEHAGQAQRHFDATSTSLFFYGLWFGGYPYEHITVVDPAWGGGAASGMEYPTLFTAGSRMFTTPRMQSPESVTVHECGHQFWYGLVGNNEFEAAWLDEGFNTFTQNEAMIRRFGASGRTTDFAALPFDGVAVVANPGGSALADALSLKKWPMPMGRSLTPLPSSGLLDWWRAQPLLGFARMSDDPRWRDRSGYLADPDTDPIDRSGWKYADSQSYRQNSYRRTAVALRSLAGLVGEERFLRGMRMHSERWRYGHPYAQDFFDAFDAGAQADLRWFFDQAFRSTATVDWSVEVTQRRVAEEKGWFQNTLGVFEKRDTGDADKDDEKTDEEKNEDDEAEHDENGDGTKANGDVAGAPGRGWKLDVLVRRKGTLLLPLKLELSFKNGRKESFVWSREDQLRAAWWRPLEGHDIATKKLASAVLDPDHLYYFDTDLSNNQWYDAVDEIAPVRWSERVLTQYSHLLHWFGGLGG